MVGECGSAVRLIGIEAQLLQGLPGGAALARLLPRCALSAKWRTAHLAGFVGLDTNVPAKQ